MDLTARLRSWTYARPRVLLVDPPGTAVLRRRVEADLDRRGWRRAMTPADTDLLLVLGEPGPELAAAVDVLWSQVPEPRHRLEVRDPDDVVVALGAGRDALIHRARSVGDGKERPSPSSLLAQAEDADHEGMDHEGMDHEGMDHEGMDHEGMDHEGMDHGHGGDVAGLPMASTGPDRDGLELDILEVALGPVLPGWPTGLVLRADLQGDVLTSAEPAWLDAGTLADEELLPDPRLAALDRLACFLDVAGWPTGARDARRARDGFAADGPEVPGAQRLAAAVVRRVRRSRTLSWTAGGLGRTRPEHGSADDVLDRVRRWCDIAAGQPVAERAPPSLDEVAALVEGAEIGSARLIVASLELLPEPAVPAPERAHA